MQLDGKRVFLWAWGVVRIAANSENETQGAAVSRLQRHGR